MPHQVFISYSSADKSIANAICSFLESEKIRCWYAPRDITPGIEYGEAILNAINVCKIMVVVLTAGANKSRHVRKEVERAVNKGLIIIPFRTEPILPDKSLEYFLSSEHWLDAMTPPLKQHIIKLCHTISSLEPSINISNTNAKMDSESDLKVIVKEFNEIAPDEWIKPSNKFLNFIMGIFRDK